MRFLSPFFNLIVIDRSLWIVENESTLFEVAVKARRSSSVPPDGGKVRTPTPIRKEAPTENLELRDLLDRILDKGLYLGSDVLLLSETSFSAADAHISLGAQQRDAGIRSHDASPSQVQPRRRK